MSDESALQSRFHSSRSAKVYGRSNFWFVVFVDACLVVASLVLSYLLRFDGIPSEYRRQLLFLLPGFVVTKLLIFYYFNLYKGMWRYTSTFDMLNVLKAVLLSSAVVIFFLFMFTRFEGISRSLLILDAILSFGFIAGHRVVIRFVCQYVDDPRELFTYFLKKKKPNNKTRLLLVGAGNTAEKILREVKENKRAPYVVVGMVDDYEAKQGAEIHGVPVIGSLDDLPHAVELTDAHELLIAIPTATRKEMDRIISLCKSTGLPYKILPGLHELIDGKVSLHSIREVDYKDLLGRPVVRLEQDAIGGYLSGKTVLVTGGGGSIGSELCRQIMKFDPAKLIILDAGEENLYNIQMELLHDHGFKNCLAVLAKIQDRELLEEIFACHRPSVVFHAAAYKHVPLVERNPWEAVFNNIFAVRNVIEASIQYGVERFVLVSTDKAVRPTNVMGASKRLTELLMLAYSRDNCDQQPDSGDSNADHAPKSSRSSRQAHRTTFMAVRFGNVLGSSGSVIPLFKRQIEQGGPVTVTDPDITRFFMSIEEASQLILQAGAMGEGGEIFILEMGTPVKIVQMAEELIRMSGKEPGVDIEIKFTGLRPGEKLYEELITEGEGIVATSHEKIVVLRGDGYPYSKLREPLSRLARLAKAHDARGIKETLKELIPEYSPDLDADAVTQGEAAMASVR